MEVEIVSTFVYTFKKIFNLRISIVPDLGKERELNSMVKNVKNVNNFLMGPLKD